MIPFILFMKDYFKDYRLIPVDIRTPLEEVLAKLKELGLQLNQGDE